MKKYSKWHKLHKNWKCNCALWRCANLWFPLLRYRPQFRPKPRCPTSDNLTTYHISCNAVLKKQMKIIFLTDYPPFPVIPSSGKSKTYAGAFDARNQSLIFWKRISLRTSLKMDYCHLTIAALFAFILLFSSQEFVSAFLKFCNFQVLHINVGCSQFSALPVIKCPVPVEFLFLLLR